jgi:AcrR family transcriptional regulator
MEKRRGEAAHHTRDSPGSAHHNPTIYRRFKNRQEILRALLWRTQQDVVDVLRTCRSPQEASQRYVEFAAHHPREYELLSTQEVKPLGGHRRSRAAQTPRSAVDLMEAKLAEFLRGSPEDCKRLHLALWALTHGTSMLLISRAVRDDLSPELLRSCEVAVKVLVKNASAFAAAK